MEEYGASWGEALQQSKESLQMLQRMERLRRLMGMEQQETQPQEEGEHSIFSETKGEKILCAAIPFLDQEYQKDLYVVVRLMQMRRVLAGADLEARSKSTESPALRRRKMLSAIRSCLSEEEGRNLELVLKVMEARQILQKKEENYGIYMGKTGNAGVGRGTSAPAAGGTGEK